MSDFEGAWRQLLLPDDDVVPGKVAKRIDRSVSPVDDDSPHRTVGSNGRGRDDAVGADVAFRDQRRVGPRWERLYEHSGALQPFGGFVLLAHDEVSPLFAGDPQVDGAVTGERESIPGKLTDRVR
jgi:hypothetical protein